jgi:hypothetical protein
MPRTHDSRGDNQHSSHDGDLGRLIRWSLQNSLGKAEPPSDGWPRVLERVRELGPLGTSSRSVRRARLPSHLVQAATLGALLLLMCLGLNRDVDRLMNTAYVRPTAVVSPPASADRFPQDTLSVYILLRMQRQVPPSKLGGIPETVL